MNFTISRILKKSILVMLLALFVSTASHAQKYVKVIETQSDQAFKTEGKTMIFENDTLSISYDFWSDRGQVSFTVFNKLDVPLYIDWKKCSFIRRGINHPYYKERTQAEVLTEYTPAEKKQPASYKTKNISYPEQRIAFIAPKSHVTNPLTYNLIEQGKALPYMSKSKEAIENLLINNKEFFDEIKVDTLNKSWTEKGTTKVYVKQYTNDNSPLHFTNFITVSTSDKFDKEIFIKNSFYISRITEMVKNQFLGQSDKSKGKFDKNRKDSFGRDGYVYPYLSSGSFFYYTDK